MTKRLKPHQIDTASATVDGQVLTFNKVKKEYEPRAVPAVTIHAGDNIVVDNTDPLNPIISARLLEPLTTEVWDGSMWVPQLVWDADNELVLTTVTPPAPYPLPLYSDLVLYRNPLAFWRLGDMPVATATASQSYSGEGPQNAFDGNTSTVWTCTAGPACWLQLRLNAPVVVTTYNIAGRAGWDARAPKDWTFQGSNDGTTWVTLDTQTAQHPTGSTIYTYTFANTVAYSYFRINITANNGDPSITNLTELQLPEAPALSFATPALTDSSPNARNGSYMGSPTLGVPGLITRDTNAAVSAAGRFGQIPYGTWMNVNQFSIEAWIKPNAGALASGVQCHIVLRDNLGNGGGDSQWRMSLESGKLGFLLWHPAVTQLVGSTLLTAGNKYHCVLTYDNAFMTIYLNGVQDAQVAATGAVTTGQPITFGAMGSNNETGWTGITDDAAFYNRALTPAEVNANFLSGTA